MYAVRVFSNKAGAAKWVPRGSKTFHAACVIVSLVALMPADVCYSSARRLCILKDVWVMIWKRLTREIRAIEYLKARHTH